MTDKKCKSLFTISIVLNVLLLGALTGIAADRVMHRPWEQMMAKDLKPETQNLLARTFQQAHSEIKGSYEEMRAAEDEMARAFSARTFDEGAYESAIKRKNAAREKVMAHRYETMKKLATELPQDEREKMANQFAKGGFHKYGFKPRMFDHPPRPPVEAAPPVKAEE